MVNSCQLQHYHGCWARRGGCNHRVPATVQLGSQPRHSPFVGAAGQLTPQAAWCLRQRAGLLQAASQGHTSMSHSVGSEAPCGELGRDAPPPGGKIPAKAGHTLSRRQWTLEIGITRKGQLGEMPAVSTLASQRNFYKE